MNGVWRLYRISRILLPLGTLGLCACTFFMRCAKRYTLRIQILQSSQSAKGSLQDAGDETGCLAHRLPGNDIPKADLDVNFVRSAGQ
jgi:hypothetical protein